MSRKKDGISGEVVVACEVKELGRRKEGETLESERRNLEGRSLIGREAHPRATFIIDLKIAEA